MKHLLLLLCSAAVLSAQERIEALGHRWTVPIASDWVAEPNLLKMLVARPQTQPRRPSQFALLDSPEWAQVRIEVEVKPLGSSLILVYAWRDAAHFNYAHLSADAPKKQPVHNGIFHVFGGDRVRISSLNGPGSLPDREKWYRVRLDYDAATSEVRVLVNDQPFQSLHGVDLSLAAGRVGLGSFFETAEFRNFRISGKHAMDH